MSNIFRNLKILEFWSEEKELKINSKLHFPHLQSLKVIYSRQLNFFIRLTSLKYLYLYIWDIEIELD